MILFYATCGILLLGGIFLAVRRARVRWRERRFLDAPFPRKWGKIIAKNVPAAEKLPQNLQERFHRHVKKFLLEKTFEPCGGLKKISDEIAISVAANASLLVCNLDVEAWRFLQSVLIYPRAFSGTFTKRVGKIVTKSVETNDGESWGAERVVLSLERIRRDIAFHGNAQNVIIHEFAHQFDATIFAAMPLEIRAAWAQVGEEEMARLRCGDPQTVIDEYGADDSAEFFAVATEAFFEKPRELLAFHRHVYVLLEKIYRLSPADWKLENAEKQDFAVEPPARFC